MEMDIGARLKEARESKGLSLEEIQQTTKIQKRYLNAIENNDFKTLPGKFYTRAFIREYASAVGLNPEEVMEEHKNELPSYEDEEIIKYSRAQRAKQQSTKTKTSGKGSSLFPRILTAIAVIAVAVVIYVFVVNMNDSPNGDSPSSGEGQTDDAIELPADSEEESNNKGEEAPTEDKSSDESTEEEPAEDQPDAPKEQPEPEVTIELTKEGTGSFPEHTYTVKGVTDRTATIELSGSAYLEVNAPKSGEDLISRGMYSAQDSPIKLDFSGKNQLYIKTGSVPNTTITINGKAVKFKDPEYSTQKVLLNFE